MHTSQRNPRPSRLARACLLTLTAAAAVATSSRAGAQPPPPPPGPVVTGNVPYEGSSAPWFVRLGTTKVWSYASGVSDDGKSVCGEMDLGDTTGPHFHGVRWDRVSSSLPQWSLTPLPFPAPGVINNFAAAISPSGLAIAGDATQSDGLKTVAYLTVKSVSKAMPYLTTFPQEQAEGRAVDDNNNIFGHIGLVPGEHDIDRVEPAVAVLWTYANGSPQATPLVSVTDVPSSKVFDVTADGTCIVGGGASQLARQAYSDVGVANEALLLRRGPQNSVSLTWLGVPSGSVRFYSVAHGIASDSANPSGLVIVGMCGGVWLDNIPKPGDRHVMDQRPAVWRVSGAAVTSAQLPLLTKSWSVPRDSQFGGAVAVSKDGRFIVGSCGTRDGDIFDSDAVIWGRGSTPRSIREVLMDAGVSSVANLIFDAATGISADGSVVCGYGHDTDYNYFGWIAQFPPLPIAPVDWAKIPRKAPTGRINPVP